MGCPPLRGLRKSLLEADVSLMALNPSAWEKPMRRRDFINLLYGSAVAWPLAVRAQQGQNNKLPIVGILGINQAVWRPWTADFVTRLSALGWIEGRNVIVEYRWSEGKPQHEAETAAEFVRLKAAVIVTYGKAAITIKDAVAPIPIVLALANDPVGGGLAKSLARPAGTLPGYRWKTAIWPASDLNLDEVVPKLRRLSILFDASYPPAVLEVSGVQTAAQSFGLEVVPLGIKQAADVSPSFATLQPRPDALYVVVNVLISSNLKQIISLALDQRLPTMFNNRDYTQAGALMSYGANYSDLFRRSADDVEKICAGQAERYSDRAAHKIRSRD